MDEDDFVDALDNEDYEDEDEIDMEDVAQPKPVEDECEVLSEGQVYSHMNEAIKDVSSLIEVSSLPQTCNNCFIL